MAVKTSIFDDLLETGRDIGKAVKAGATSIASGGATGVAKLGEAVGNTANVVSGKKLFDGDAERVRRIARELAASADKTRNSISARGKEASQKSAVSGNLLEGEIDFGEDPSVRGYAINIAEGLGSMAPTIAAGVATKGRSLKTQLATGAGVGAVTGGGAAAQSEGDRIRGMDDGALSALPGYQASIAQGLDPAAAREAVARQAETGAFVATAPVSALGGAATGALFGAPAQAALARVAGGSRVAQVTGSGAISAIEEGAQETAEGVAQIAGARAMTGEERDLGEGSAQNAALGALTGGPAGLAAGALNPTEPTAPGPGSPDSQTPTSAVIDPSRGTLSRAVAAGAASGMIPGVEVVGDQFLGAPPPPLDAAPLLLPGQAPGASAEAVAFAPQAAAAAAERGMPYVAPTGTISPWAGTLKPEERLLESKSALQVLSDPEAAVAAYESLKGTDGGRVISTDEAREIFPEYSAGPEGRSKFALAVHEPASFVAKEVWARKLEQPVAADREPRVVFTAGGTGAGKTTAIKRNPDAKALQDSADLIYDGNLQSAPSAIEKIEQAKASGRRVDILYVHREPVKSFTHGAIPRANKEDYGRTVPVEAHTKTHIGAAKTVLELAQHYANDPLVSVQLVNNAEDQVTPIEQQISAVSKSDYNALKGEIDAALEQARNEGILAKRVEDYYFPSNAGASGSQSGAQPGAAGEAGFQAVDQAVAGSGGSQPQAGAGAGGQVAFLGSRSAPSKITAAQTGDAMGGIVDFKLDRDGETIGEAQAYKEKFAGKDAWHLGFVGVNKDARGGTGAPAMRAAINQMMRNDPAPDHVTAEAMSKKSLRAMIRVLGNPITISDDIREMSLDEAIDRLPDDSTFDEADGQLFGDKVFVAFQLPNSRKLSEPRTRKPGREYGVIVAPKPGTKVTVDGEARPYQRGVDTTLPPAAAPVQRDPDLEALQARAAGIFKRPAAAAALRRLFGVTGVKATTIRGSYEGVPELSFHLTAEGLTPENAGAVSQFLGMAFMQDAVIVTKPDPVGPTDDSIPTIELASTNGAKIDQAVFDAVTAELREQGIDYSEVRDGRAIRVLHFGDEGSFESLVVAMNSAALANGLKVDTLHTRSDLHEAQDYRRNLQEAWDGGSAGQRPEVFRALVDHFLVPYTSAISAAGYRVDAQRYAERFGLTPEELSYLNEKLAPTGKGRSTVALLSGKEALPSKDGRSTNADAAFFLQNRAAAFGEINPSDRSARALKIMSDTFAEEVAYQLSKPEGKQAIGWYDRQLKAALNTIAEVHPEIADDQGARFVFNSLLATTSQGLTVEQNFNAALKLYQSYKDKGVLDMKGVTLPGKAAPVAKQNVEKLQSMINDKGLDGAREFLQGMHTVRDLKKAGFSPRGGMDERVRGWFVFGPKIGSFANNLDGDFDTLTADLWFSRTWNRALGSMFNYSHTREVDLLRTFRAEMVKALNEGGNEIVDGLSDADRGRLGELDFDLALAKSLNNNFAKNRYSDRSKLNVTAKNLTENANALRDVPRGDPERRWQQEVMVETQRKLEKSLGQRVSIADLQALLWYQEKELFRILGAANKSSAPLDYQDAAKAAVDAFRGKFLGARDGGTIAETAYPLGGDYLLKTLRKIVPDARVVIVAGTDRAASRVAIDRELTAAETAAIKKIGGMKRVVPGAFPSNNEGLADRAAPPRFQVPTSVSSSRHFAALTSDQQALVDKALGDLKKAGYPKAWLGNAAFFFAHNNDQSFSARFYLAGELRGAVSIRQEQLDKGIKPVKRAIAHELAHAADFDPETGGFYSTVSPLFDLTINEDGSIDYTGEIIAELKEAHGKLTPLTEELNYPFADWRDFNSDVIKVEAFAQAMMLYHTQNADLKRHAPKTYQLLEEMQREATNRPNETARAVSQALRAGSIRPIDLRPLSVGSEPTGGRVDRSKQDRPEADGREARSGRGREQGVDSKTPSTPAEKFFAELREITMANPFGGGEQVFMHSNGGAFGAASVSPGYDGRVRLDSIRSFGAGNGYGSYVLGKITDLADKHGLALELTAKPYGEKNLSKAKLVAWYKRHGFTGTGERMIRQPVKPEDDAFLGSRAPGMPPSDTGFEGYTIPSWEMSDHLRSEAGHRMQGYRTAAAGGAEKLRTYLQDYFLPVRRVQEAIQKTGGEITEDTDVYGREEVYYGRTGERLRQIEDDHVKPLAAAMLEAKVSQADLELYLYAKFAPKRNERIAAINPKFPDGGSGMTNADAAQVLADFKAAGQTAALEALAKRVRALNAVRLDVLEEGGLLSPGEADLWREEPDYVPLKGFADGDTDGGGETRMPTGRGFSIGGKEAHRALGRKSRATDLLANTVAQVQQAIIRAEKNRVAIALLRLAESNPNEALWSVDKAPQVAQLSPKGEVTYRTDNRHKLADNVVSVKIAGTEHFITLHDDRLAAAMKNLGAAKMGAFLRGFSAVNRFLSLTRTMLAPEFMLANFARDLQTASVNLTADQSASMAASVVKDVPKAMRAMWSQLRNKEASGEWATWAQEFSDAGGMTAFVAQWTVEEQQAKINKLLNSAKSDPWNATKRLAKETFGLIEDVNGTVENATRLSAYVNARKRGLSEQDAARLAKNLTVNFNRKGQAGPTINALYLFYNASIQGTTRFLRAMRSPKVQKLMAATAVIGYSLAMFNRAAGGEDDDGEDRWDKIPEWEKARNLIIFIPGTDGDTIKIPLPYSYNLPFVIGSQLESTINGRQPVSTAAANIAETVLTAFSPIGELDLKGDSATALAKLATPTAADPLLDIAVNRNFFGAPINPERSPFDKVPEPDSQLAFPSANPAARWLANALNTATGGDALTAGAIDISPGSMVYVFDYLTGGTGSFVERTATAAMLMMQGEEVPANKVPFVRVFKGELSDRRVTDTFYRVRDDVNLKAELAELARKGGFDSPAQRRDAALGRRLEPKLRNAERQLSKVRKLRKQAQLDGRKDVVKTLEARERTIQLRFNTQYFSALDASGDSE